MMFKSFLFVALLPAVKCFSLSDQPLSKLLSRHASSIAGLKDETQKIVPSLDVEPYSNDVFYLRYCLQDFESDDDRLHTLKENLNWRVGDGKSICDAAQASIAEATADGKWNNDPVRNAAPHADKINPYLTTVQTITTSTSKGDLFIVFALERLTTRPS